jgi:riboflavin biosynthesis pyrimidine reductase
MITSADGASFTALRAAADVVLVGLNTALAERYRDPGPDGPELCIVTSRPARALALSVVASGAATLVVPEDVGPLGPGVRAHRVGTGGRVDLAGFLVDRVGKVVLCEGGPTLAGNLLALGLLDEYFLTVAPRLLAGTSPRVVSGPYADQGLWTLLGGFSDAEGYLFLRYARPPGPTA